VFKHLSELISEYTSIYQEEVDFIMKFEELLTHPDAFQRYHLPGHITGSAWVVNQDHSKVLLHHHRKLDKWLQPGGHADGDENVLGVALRELEEETGIRQVKQLGTGIFDLDIHPIPARKDVPGHLHYDVRFCFEANESESILVSDESLDVKWMTWDELKSNSSNESLFRMMKKSAKL
jgi:8-oxo-dGTP pyrophosphatase MutT (NUDIX family)